MNAAAVNSAPPPPREYDAAAKSAKAAGAKTDNDAPVDGESFDAVLDEEFDISADTADTGDGTRAAQDLLAASLVLPAPTLEVPAIDPQQITSTAVSIEAAVQSILDQVVADKPTDGDPLAKDDSTDEDMLAGGEVAIPEMTVAPEADIQTQPAMTPKGPVATTAVREPAPLPENANPSHVHLVLDDGPERVVMTVAVRGTEVQTTIRTGDEQLAASLARNAASLDHALRTKGLDLSSFSSDRDLEHRERELPHHQRRQQQKQHDEETA